MHKQLRIVKGIQGAPGDVYTLESGYTTIDLLRGSAEGFALRPEPSAWNPTIAQPKQGLWYETAFNDGRTLFAGADQNVMETMQLSLSAPDMIRLGYWMRSLNLMQADALRFWEDEHIQYDPVFLWWWADGAPGPQFALIYQIQIAISDPTALDANQVIRDVTLTIEREPYWRGLPPGANPVIWTLQQLGEEPGLDYNYNDGQLELIGANSPYTAPARALVAANLQNRLEYWPDGSGDWAYFAQNFITIPAASIPGDAPALLSVALRVDTNSGETATERRMMIARRTADLILRNKTNDDNYLFVNMLPAIQADAASGTSATLAVANDTGGNTSQGGGIGAGSTTTAKRLEITPTSSLAAAVQFISDQLNAVVQRGRFAVFARCRQDSGTAGDITMQLQLAGQGGYSLTPETAVPLQAGTGNTTRWPLMYMGTVNLPNDRAAPVALGTEYGGTGLNNGSNSTLSITVNVRRSTGSSKLYIADFIFMPIDEGFVDMLPIATSSAARWILYDNTGYTRHGRPEALAQLFLTDNFATPIEMRGPDIELTPQQDNNLFFLYRIQDDTSNVREDITAHVNIVPRWRYIRDA